MKSNNGLLLKRANGQVPAVVSGRFNTKIDERLGFMTMNYIAIARASRDTHHSFDRTRAR